MLCSVKQSGEVKSVFLENDRGMKVELLSFGACLKKVSVPVDGIDRTLTMTYRDIEEYTVRSTGNCGKTLAPNAGEIGEEKGITMTDGSVIHPFANRGGNSLHGGAHAGNVRNWELEDFGATEKTAYAVFSLTLPDALDGWDGNRSFEVRYSINNGDIIEIALSAVTDRPTYINMSNHAYWNLDNDTDRAEEQRLFINAEGMYLNGADSLPVRLADISEIKSESGVDFNKPNLCRELCTFRKGEYGAQIQAGNGLDNAFLLRKQGSGVQSACVLESADGKTAIELLTDAPDLVVYQAGLLKEGVILENGQTTRKNCSIALEAQEIPNLKKNRPLLPGETFNRTVCYIIYRR